jgi:cell division protein FtsI/penicillin-binding protein 2
MLIPYILTIVFTISGLLLMLVIAWAALRHRNPSTEDGLEGGPLEANSWIGALRFGFIALLVTVAGFHSYWVFKADSSEHFARAKRLDARHRRVAESGLKGWVLDRSGKLDNALIRYRNDGGLISRDYPLGEAAVHLTGYSDFVFGAGGMEYGFADWLTEPASMYNRLASVVPVGKDLTVSADASLQREAFKLIGRAGKPGAAVVLLLPNNEVLAMASAPSFEPGSINDEVTWRRMSEQAEKAQPLSPLVNRATSTLVTGGPAFYYRPGSTFKTFIAGVAIDTGTTGEVFQCKAEGFTPPGSGRPIRDYGGEVHGKVGLREGFVHSCNQYFAQLGLKLGRRRLADYARRLGVVSSPDEDSRRANRLWHVIHADVDRFNFIFAPPTQRMNLSSGASAYDVALQSIGQGFDDSSVLYMALIASAAASTDGAFVAPTFEVGAERRVISPFINPQSAAQLRTLMRQVVESGTAAGAFATLRGRISAGGKTGTADREVTVYDAQGKPVIAHVDESGRPRYRTRAVTDGWYIGFAPGENPRIAFAVLVEEGGQGAASAAPIAVKLIEKAASLGYLKPDGR